MTETDTQKILAVLERIAAALERGKGAPEKFPAITGKACIWQAETGRLKAVKDTGALPLSLLVGLEQQAEILHRNTLQFAKGLPANNALLWGARGMGKSSLVKAVHRDIAERHPGLTLVEIFREDIGTLPRLLDILRDNPDRCFLLFCDDLSFDGEDSGYKSLKTVLEGGLEARPRNVLLYATSNRRHLIPRQMIENERATAIHPGESLEEKVSLSDRFGLWLGFYPCDQDQYLAMVENYARTCGLKIDRTDMHVQAIEWYRTRGARSGRVAWQFIQDLAGRLGKEIS